MKQYKEMKDLIKTLLAFSCSWIGVLTLIIGLPVLIFSSLLVAYDSHLDYLFGQSDYIQDMDRVWLDSTHRTG